MITAITTTALRIDLIGLAIGMKRLMSHKITPTMMRVITTVTMVFILFVLSCSQKKLIKSYQKNIPQIVENIF